MEVKDVLEALGLPTDIDSIEGVVAAGGKQFILRKEVDKDKEVEERMFGRFAGEFVNLFKKSFGLEKSEIEGLHVKEVFRKGIDTMTTKMQELEEAAGKAGGEQYEKLDKQLKKLKEDTERLTNDNKKLIQEKTEIESGFNGKIKQFKTEHAYAQSRSKIKWPHDTLDVTKEGFDFTFNKKYKIDIDENEQVVVLGSDGKPVPNKSKTGVYLSLDEVIESELDSQGLGVKNNLPKKQASVQNSSGNNTNVENSQSKMRINPAALKMAEQATT